MQPLTVIDDGGDTPLQLSQRLAKPQRSSSGLVRNAGCSADRSELGK